MFRAILLCVGFAVAAFSDDRWIEFHAGPFQVLTTSAEKQARDTLNELEQLRHVLGNTIGKQDLKPVWPIRIVVVKSGRAPVYAEPKLARDAYIASVIQLEPETRRRIAELLIEANAGRLPAELEHGLVELFSTLEADGPRVSVGAPPAKPDRDWMRVHMLMLDPRFSGKLRVLLYNLQQGVEPEPAYKNAFDMTPEQVERELDKYIQNRQFAPGPLSGKPLDPRRQLIARDVEKSVGELAMVDLQVANGQRSAAPEYSRFPGALDAAVPVFEKARQEKDRVKARQLYEQAAKLNPLWAAPHWFEAQIEDNSVRKIQLLKNAAQLSPRLAEYWVTLAHAQEAAGLFADAVKSWAAAERASGTAEEKARITQARVAGEQQRLEKVRQEKEEAKRKAEAEIEALRQKSLESIRTAEAKANAGRPERDPNEKLDFYREDMGYGKIAGQLRQIQCLGRQAVLHIVSDDGKLVKLHIADPSKVAITDGGEQALGCGVQKRGRPVTVQYLEKANAKLGTAGEVTSIEFR